MQSNIDEVPIGGGSSKTGPQMDEEYANTSTADKADTSGPLEERIVSKNWSVRASAFDELNIMFKGSKGKHDEVFKEHMGSWKKYLGDSNPGALEKCLDALQSFIDLADPKVTVMSQNDIIKLLIEKCLGHAKPTIKQKGLECFNLIFEVTESFDDSIETMIESLNSKNIKVSQAAQVALNSWIGNYGAKKVQVKPFLKVAEANANSSNPTTRSEAMNFYKECFKWLGQGLKPLIQDNLKKQQMDDLDKAFEEIKDKPKNQRYTRTEKQKQKDDMLDGIIKQEEEQKSASSVAYDLAEPFDLIGKYNPEWQEKLGELKKWTEKKEQLEQLISDSNVPKLKNGEYFDLVKVLKKFIGDSNQVVSTLAIKACGNLAKGLRQDFEPYCKELVPVLIQKFKEKRTQTIDEAHDVLNNIANCTSLDFLSQEIAAGIADKAPPLKKNVCLFLEKFAQITYIDVLQRSSQDIIQNLLKSSDDQAGEVRDAALSALGIFKGRLGEAQMSKYLSDLNPQKLAKVNESALTVKPSKYDRPEKKVEVIQKGKPPVKTETKKAPPKKQEVKKKEVEEEKKGYEDVQMVQEEPMQNNFDDMPIGGNKTNFDDDRPLGGAKSSMFDEKPIGGNKGYNLDDLEMLEQQENAMNSQPKKAPPARFKPKETKDINEDVEMDSTKEEQKKPVIKKERPPPKEETKKPASSTNKPAGKAATSSAGQEEESGGLSKEEAIAKVNDTFNPEIVAKMEETKWQDKVEGFKGIGEQIVELQPGQDIIEGLAKYVKMKMKDWKESNVNLIKECIALFLVIAQNCEKVNKRAVSCLMPFLSDKLGDVKVITQTQELVMALAELVTPKFIGLQIIKYGSTAKSPKVLQESCNILNQMTEEFGGSQMPLKEMIDFGNAQVAHSNPQVRTAAMALFAVMYKHVGETIKNFLKDIKESTMKLLDAEFAKVTVLKKGEFHNKRGLRGEAAEENDGGKGGKAGGGLDSLPREDISKQITPKLITMFKNQEWKIRKEAADKVEEMLKAANMRIQPVGLNELMDNMKQRMADPNKAVLKSYLQLICLLVEALGQGAKQYSKKLLPPILQNLADKQTLVRGDTITNMDKWAEHTGPENVINHLGPLLVQENPELRTEALQWMGKHKDQIKLCDCKELAKPLMSCLNDKVPLIRGMAEALATDVFVVTGYGPFKQVMDDLKPAVQNTLKPILEKIKLKCGNIVVNESATQNLNSSLGNRPQTSNQDKKDTIKPSSNKVQSVTNKGSTTSTNKEEPKQVISTFAEAASKKKQQTLQTPVASKGRSESKEPTIKTNLKQSLGGSNQQQQNSSIKEFQSSEDQPVIASVHGLREKRIDFDKKNKWIQEELKSDQIDRLKGWTSQVFGQTLSTKMFSNDFKQHTECIEQFLYFNQQTPDQFRDNLDIVFKWSLIKMGDSSNTQFAVKLFDFLSSLFQDFTDNEHMIADFEANVIFPLLCDKTGINNAILKEKVKKLIRMIYNIYDKSKCYSMLVLYGLQSKNMRTSGECLEEMAEFMKIFGINYSTEKDIKLVAKMADSNDKAIRENSLKVMAEVYKQLGNDIWRIIGDVTPKVQGLFEQRFKKTQGLASSISTLNLGGTNQGNHTELPSPKADKGRSTQIGFGVKTNPLVSNIDKQKTITPRNNLTLNKIGQPNKQNEQSFSNPLSKSINPYNAPQEEQKKIPSGIPRKQDQLRRVSTQDESVKMSQTVQGKKLIPQTQRQDSGTSGIAKFGRRGSELDVVANMKPGIGQGSQQKSLQKSMMGGAKDMLQEDDDVEFEEDITMNLQKNDVEMEEDQEFQRQQEDIIRNINQLKYGDLSKRVDSLVSLNELISQIDTNKSALVQTGNDLINAFTHVLMDIFERPLEEIPLRFAKYFITIVLKACSCKEIMRDVNEEKIFELAEQLLTRLLIENLDKVGENKEGELILKNLNSSMLRLLENCNHTYIFCVLFNLLRKYKDYNQLPKLPGLIIKCLLKLSKILEKLIDKLDMQKILLAIHEYLVVVNHENKTQNDEMGIRIVKTVINELVKLKRDNIMEAYQIIQDHPHQDNHILRWIQIILKSLQSTTQYSNNSNTNSASQGASNTSVGSVEQEIKALVEELRNSEQFENAIPKLYAFLESNPEVDLNFYLQDCSKTFQQFIKSNLDKYRSNNEESKEGEQLGMMDSMKSTNNSDGSKGNLNKDGGEASSSNRINEYQNKLTSIKQRFNQKTTSGENTNNNKDQATHNLNTSFSAMNTSLSQKWHEINKKNAVTKREGVQASQQQMSSTLGGFGGNSGANTLVQRQNSNLNQSSGVNQGGDVDQQNTQGATNQDLNKRLAEMKAKLQALKKK